jgi:hypothetical protein
MPKFKSQDLITDLQKDVKRIAEAGEFFSTVDKPKMVYCVEKNRWSIVQILEHLNAYGRYYLPLMEREMAFRSKGVPAWFSSGTFGNYFTKSMKPKTVFEVKNKMKAMKSYSFPNSLNVETVLKEFREQQTKLHELLEMARDRDLNSIRIPITISKLIKLKLGDVFRFVVAHEQRHMIQARNTLKATGESTDRFPVILEATPQ